MEQQPQSDESVSTDGRIVSPFAQTNASILERKKRGTAGLLWIGAGIVVVVAALAGIYGYLNDPYRTLEAFPVAKYFESYRALAGSRFKSELRVEADLGWKEGKGRLMAFTIPQDTRVVVVMIPPKLANIYFTKGQTYLAELEVKEGGLIYADSCRKE